MLNRRWPIDRPDLRVRSQLVALIWLYFALLILEGALRKWVLPQFSNQLLLVRDPVALAILYIASASGQFPKSRLIDAFGWLFGAFALLAALQLVVYGTPLGVLLFGLRTYFLHPLVAFVMAQALTPRDLKRFVLALCILAVPIALLMVRQFNAGPLDFLNRGVGVGGGQLPSAMGKVRPAGPFSFITGPVLYFDLLAAMLLSANFGTRRIPLWWQIAAWAALLVAAAVSGSRSLIFGLVPVFVALTVAIVRRPSLVGPLFRVVLIIVTVGMLLWSTTAVQEGLEVFSTRMVESGGLEEMLLRSSTLYVWSIGAWTEAPLLGYGLGLGTNVGSSMAGTGAFQFGENEWTRVLFEAGPILGVLYLLWRVWLAMWVLLQGFRAAKTGDLLATILAGASVLNLVIGQWGQPTTQGFAIFGAGLCLAAINCSEASMTMFRRARVPGGQSSWAYGQTALASGGRGRT